MIRAQLFKLILSLRHKKLSQDIAYSLGSFVVLALSGIVINIVITGLRDAAALGVFNLAYAVYIIASQFAVWGLHYSVLRHAAFYEHDSNARGGMLLTAGVCALLMGFVAAICVYLSEPLFSVVFDSETTGAAIKNSAWGLIFFPLNKILIAYLNGLRCMKAFSILQAMRYLVVMALVAVISASELPVEFATFCFVAAEILTAIFALICIKQARLVNQLSFSSEWVVRHYRFGTKGLAAGMFAEVNSRIDVLLIGFFLSDRETGIYSFAAMLVDGVYHVLAMIRINFNPILVAAARDNDWSTGQYLRRQSLKIVLPATLLMSFVLVLSYYFLGAWVMPPEKGILDGLPTLVILLSALVMVSFLVPFDNLLMVSGLPGFQTFQQLILVGVNIVVAVPLLPLIGIEGAAFGTALSYISGILAMVVFVRYRLGWNLINNKLEL